MIIETALRLRLGPYSLVRRLEDAPFAARWLGRRDDTSQVHLVYRFPTCPDRHQQRRFMAALGVIAELDHPHILPIEQFSFESGNRAYVVSPYTGDAGGLVTLEKLVRSKGGRMEANEARRAVVQLLQAVCHAHGRGIFHGSVSESEVLVDRRGSLCMELYGFRRAVDARSQAEYEAAADEVRSVVGIAYRLISGLTVGTPHIPAARMTSGLDARWDDWFRRGLDRFDCFRCAGDALREMPPARGEEPPGAGLTELGRLVKHAASTLVS